MRSRSVKSADVGEVAIDGVGGVVRNHAVDGEPGVDALVRCCRHAQFQARAPGGLADGDQCEVRDRIQPDVRQLGRVGPH